MWSSRLPLVGDAGFSDQAASICPGFWGELQSREVTPKDQDLGSSGFSSCCCSQFSDQLTPSSSSCLGPIKELYCKEKKLIKGLFHCESLSANEAQASWLSSSAVKCTNNISIPTSASAICRLRMLGHCWCRHSPKTRASPGYCWEAAAALSTGLGSAPSLGRVDAIHPRARAQAKAPEPDSSPLFAVGAQLTAQSSVEFHITPVETKLEPDPAGFWVEFVQFWLCSIVPPDPHPLHSGFCQE